MEFSRMKGGMLGLVSGTHERVDSFQTTRQSNEMELRTRVEVSGIQRTPDGVDITEGKAAREVINSRETVDMDSLSLTITDEEKVEREYTNFASINEKLVIVKGRSGRFLFEVLADRYGTPVEQASIDLDALYEANRDAIPWKVGFYGHSDLARNGVIHGKEVLNDSDFGDVLQRAPKNQLGLIFDRPEHEEKVFLTRSGYVEIYQPVSYDTADFVRFLDDVVLPHASV